MERPQIDNMIQQREAPPSVLSDISPARGQIARVTAFPLPPTVQANAKAAVIDLPPRAGESHMSIWMGRRFFRTRIARVETGILFLRRAKLENQIARRFPYAIALPTRGEIGCRA